jgi:hypothetical protein
MSSKRGQATVEYLLLMVVIAAIFFKVIVHVQDIFYGWGGQQGAIELFIKNQVVDKLSTTEANGWQKTP